MLAFNNLEVEAIFKSYPEHVRPKMLALRKLVLDTATEMKINNRLEETLKWGEPSFVTKQGSTIRMHWKPSHADQYAMYFHCKTKLVDTFKELYPEEFSFDGNRAIVFKLKDAIPVEALKHCVSLSLSYHKIKHLPLLGA